MSLEIKCGDQWLSWQEGKPKPIGYKVHALQANNNELELIRRRFDNIPIAHGSYCIWKGEMAQFIYDNL